MHTCNLKKLFKSSKQKNSPQLLVHECYEVEVEMEDSEPWKHAP